MSFTSAVYSISVAAETTSNEFTAASGETLRGTAARSGSIVKDSITVSKFDTTNWSNTHWIAVGK